MDYKIRLIRYLYYLSLVGLLILYLYPGSLLGYFFWRDFTKQPDFVPNPFGTSINHALAFFYLSIVLELSHLIIPNRSFQSLDLFANLLGTLLAIVVIFFYKRLKNGKI